MLLNLVKNPRADIDKIYLNVKDPCEAKYQWPIKGREKVGTKKHPRTFIKYLQTTDDLYATL